MHVTESRRPQLDCVTRYTVFDPPWGGGILGSHGNGRGDHGVVIIPVLVSTLSLLPGSASEVSHQWRELRARSKF